MTGGDLPRWPMAGTTSPRRVGVVRFEGFELLDGYRATSNQRAFAWARSHGPGVAWVPDARWVADRDRWTSSGIAAGIDVALGLVAHLLGSEVAEEVADRVEHDWHRDPSWDPFAAKNGLVAT